MVDPESKSMRFDVGTPYHRRRIIALQPMRSPSDMTKGRPSRSEVPSQSKSIDRCWSRRECKIPETARQALLSLGKTDDEHHAGQLLLDECLKVAQKVCIGWDNDKTVYHLTQYIDATTGKATVTPGDMDG